VSAREKRHKKVFLENFVVIVKQSSTFAAAAIVIPKLDGSENNENFLFIPEIKKYRFIF
jgi:hypothetical protein